MCHNLKRRITPGELPPHGPISRAHDLCTQSLFRCKVFVIQLKLDPHLNLRSELLRDSVFGDRAVPILEVKENIVPKVLSADEPECVVGLDEHDLPQTTTLDSESLFDFDVVFGMVHRLIL